MWLEWILVGKKSGDCAISQPRNNLSRYFSSKNMNPYLVWGICLAVVCLERGLERVYISHISTLVVGIKKKKRNSLPPPLNNPKENIESFNIACLRL